MIFFWNILFYFIICVWVRLGGATVARLTPDQKVACSNHVQVKIFILINDYYYFVPTLVIKFDRENFLIASSSWHRNTLLIKLYFKRVLLFDSMHFCKTWCRNGSASDSRSEGCVFKSRPGQNLLFWSTIIGILYQHLALNLIGRTS